MTSAAILAGPWILHDLAPWVRRSGHTVEYGRQYGGGWLIVSKRRVVVDDTGAKTKFATRWVVLWAPAGFRPTGPSIVVVLFGCRRLKAALALAEAWVASGKVTP